MLTAGAKILVTGCGGMLGDAIYHTFHGKYSLLATDIDLNAPWLKLLDVRALEQVENAVEVFQPSYILHLAALTDLEECERHSDEAHRTNTLGTENIVRVCQKLHIPIIYISTAGVFDGRKDTYCEKDHPHPINVYGQSKYAGELAVRQHCSKFFIFRAGWMMGGGPSKDKKFVNKIMKKLLRGERELFVVDDKLGSPTYTFDFARNLELVLMKGPHGLYHMVGGGSGSRFDVAQEMLKLLKRESGIALNRVDSSYFRDEYFAVRPPSEQLLNDELTKRGLNRMRHWKESLREYLASHDWNIS